MRATTKFLDQHLASQTAQDGEVPRARDEPPGLRRRGLLLQLDDTAGRRLGGERQEELDRHLDARGRGVVLDDDGQVDRLGHGQVVAAEGGIGGPGQRRRRQHDAVGARGFRLPRQGDCPVRRRVRDARAHGDLAIRRLERGVQHRGPLRVAEPSRLAEHAQDREAVHARRPDERHQAGHGGRVERPVGKERCRDDVPDPAQCRDVAHAASVVDRQIDHEATRPPGKRRASANCRRVGMTAHRLGTWTPIRRVPS